MGRVQLHEVNACLFAADSRVDEILNRFLDLELRHRAHRAWDMIAALTNGWGGDRLADPFLLQRHHRRRRLVEHLHNLRLFLHQRQDHRQGIHAAGIALTAGVVQLDAEFRAVPVDPPHEFAHRLDMVVVAHGELGKGRGRVHVVDAADARDDQSHAAFGPLLIVVHELFRGLAVGLTHAELGGGHDRAVFDFQIADLHRREKH